MENTMDTKGKTSSPLHLKLQGLEKILSQRIRGQAHVIPRVVSVLQRGELGLTKPTRPRGRFMILATTGVHGISFWSGQTFPFRHERIPDTGIARRLARRAIGRARHFGDGV